MRVPFPAANTATASINKGASEPESKAPADAFRAKLALGKAANQDGRLPQINTGLGSTKQAKQTQHQTDAATERPVSRLIWFIHFHKCAGTSLVDSLLANGHQAAQRHHNGNPLDSSGQQLDFARFSPDELSYFVDQTINSGTTFVCSEFSNPRLDWLKKDPRVHTVTILRDPISRMISNWKFDLINNFKSADQQLSAYIQKPQSWCSPRYYTLSLSAMSGHGENTEKNRHQPTPLLQQALQALNHFDTIAIQENPQSLNLLAATLGVNTLTTSNKTETNTSLLKDCLKLRVGKARRRLMARLGDRWPPQRPLTQLCAEEQAEFASDLTIYARAQDRALASAALQT